MVRTTVGTLWFVSFKKVETKEFKHLCNPGGSIPFLAQTHKTKEKVISVTQDMLTTAFENYPFLPKQYRYPHCKTPVEVL